MRVSGLSDVGRIRARNEDAVGWDEAAAMALVADGMGGHPGGDVASALVKDTVSETVQRESGQQRWLDAGGDPVAALPTANEAILSYARSHPDYRGMGTTAVVAAFDEHYCRIGHIGDSRAYHLQEGRLTQLTRDHTVAQQALDQQLITAEQARHTPERHQLTRALGLDLNPEIDALTIPYNRGDVFLLCTDGLTEMVDDEAIRAVLVDNPHDPEHASRLLVRLALEHGGSDNVTVAVICC